MEHPQQPHHPHHPQRRTLNQRPLADCCRVTGGAKRPPPMPMPTQAWIGDVQGLCPSAADDAEVKQVTDALYGILTKGRKPAPKGEPPHILMTIGAPGAGKSTVARTLLEGRSGVAAERYVDFDFDTVVELLPEGAALRDIPDLAGRPTGVGFAYGWERCTTQAWWARLVYRRLLEERFHIIMQAHNPELLAEAGAQGYVCTLLYVAVSQETALRRAAARALEKGRFLEPATAKNAWGWADTVASMWSRYRLLVPWFALWADNFALVGNDVDGRYPGPDDFRVFVAHPPLAPDQDWHSVLAGFYAAIAEAHGEKPGKK